MLRLAQKSGRYLRKENRRILLQSAVDVRRNLRSSFPGTGSSVTLWEQDRGKKEFPPDVYSGIYSFSTADQLFSTITTIGSPTTVSSLTPRVGAGIGSGRNLLLAKSLLGSKSRGTQNWQAVASFSTEPSLKTSRDDPDDEQREEYAALSTTTTPVNPTLRPRSTPSHVPSRKLGKTQVPTPTTGPEDPMDQLSPASTKGMIRQGMEMAVSLIRMVTMFTLHLPGNLFYFLTHPTEFRDRALGIWDIIKHEANHYWVGTKLLWEEIKTARNLLGKTLVGTALTRRERKQLLRTVSDLFRLIPFSMFVLIPFMEFALPFALRLFPNMLPSTYQDSLKAEESMKRELKSRIAMAEFFQETLEELAKEQKRKASTREKELEDAGVDLSQEADFTAHRDSASSMLEFLEKARSGEMIPSEVIYRYANYFQDDLTLDNMPRMQLINMCRYMGIQPYGSESFLRFQLRHKIRTIKEDDGRILWEGIGSLNKMELREACQERGMRSTGLSKEAYRRALKEWLDLSVNKDVPIALLIMSRTFFLQKDVFEPQTDTSSAMSGLADAISGLDKEIVNEAILEVATSDEKRSDPEVRKIKLEVLSQQNELIREEEAAREAAAKKLREEEAREEAAKLESKDGASDTTVSSESAAELSDSLVKKAEASAAVTTDSIPTKHAVPDVAASQEVHDEDKSEKLSVDNTRKEEDKTEEKQEDEGTLSPAEMDAISQLWTDDPVSKERADLERIKAAMKTETEEELEPIQEAVSASSETSSDVSVEQDSMADVSAQHASLSQAAPTFDEDKLAKETIESDERKVMDQSERDTTLVLDTHLPKEERTTDEGEEEEEVEDPIIARLKKRVKSMVDKIEVQLTETQIKIGDKLHFLDKDKDGIFTIEEMAEALQTVLRRNISFEEALEIASNMDVNEDGLIVVNELVRWIDEHKLVELSREGRDADMDRIMESHVAQSKQDYSTSTKPPK